MGAGVGDALSFSRRVWRAVDESCCHHGWWLTCSFCMEEGLYWQTRYSNHCFKIHAISHGSNVCRQKGGSVSEARTRLEARHSQSKPKGGVASAETEENFGIHPEWYQTRAVKRRFMTE